MATKDEIFDYVMHTPENTNPAVLKSLLDGIAESSGSNIDGNYSIKLITLAAAEAFQNLATQSLYITADGSGGIMPIPYCLATSSIYQIVEYTSNEQITGGVIPSSCNILYLFGEDDYEMRMVGDTLNGRPAFMDLEAVDSSTIPFAAKPVYYPAVDIKDCFYAYLTEDAQFFIIPSSTGDITTDPQFGFAPRTGDI